MAADGKVVFEITADDAPLKKTVNQTESWLKKLDLGNIFDFSIGSMLADAVGTIGTALKDFATESVGLASDLQEVQNVVDVTFGNDAKTIETWSKKANKQFGLTELQAKKYTSTLGAMMKSSGLTGKAVTSMSTDLAGLAADMASFYNLDFETAFEKIRSGISGETEPLKQLGINMSVANLEAYALSQGITKSYESMTQAEQVTLRYNYLMQATADAQGDFARTSDSLANSQRILSTNIETLKANLGEMLLPVINDAVNALNGLFEAMTPDVDLAGTFDQIEADYEASVAEINSKEFTALGLIDELERLGTKTSLTSDEQLEWNATLEKLAETIPDVSKYINLQTGEIEGGTKALRDNVEAWAENARQQALATVMQDKFAALAETQEAAASALVDYTAKSKELDEAQKNLKPILDDITDAAGLQHGTLDFLIKDNRNLDEDMRAMYGISYDQAEAYNVQWEAVQRLSNENDALKSTYENLNQQVAEGTERLNDEIAAYEEISGAQSDTLQATEDYISATEAQIAQLGKVSEALQPLIDYQKEVRDATLAQVESVISGFDRLEVGTEASISGMIEGLNSQIAFMDTYAANMQEAARRGVDEGLLASLSDGSVESAEYLAAILAGTDEDIQALNEKWQLTQEGKDTFTSVLSDMKLKADTEYQAILNKATTTIAELNMKSDATASLEATVQGIIDGINSKAPEVQAAVDNIKGMLNQLSETPSANFGDIWLGRKPGKYADGLDYVPYDDFPAYLHRGEAVLTADEAQFWRAMGENNVAATSTAPMDYNALAAAVWSQAPQQNISVVLDTGELVGAISTRQGQELQSYQMSKWQPR